MRDLFKNKNVLTLFLLSILFVIISIVLFIINLFIENPILSNAAGISLSLSLTVNISFSITINTKKQTISSGDNSNNTQLQNSPVLGDFYNGSPNGADAESSFKIEIKTKAKLLLDTLEEIEEILNFRYDPLKLGTNKYISKISLDVAQTIKSIEPDYKKLKSMVGALHEEKLNEAIERFLKIYDDFQKYCIKEYDLENNRLNLRTSPRKTVEQTK